MRSYNHIYETLCSFKSFLDGIELGLEERVLVRIHSGRHTAQDMSVLAADIKTCLPNATIIGCSTSHIICEGRILENTCLISLTTFEDCEIRSAMVECIAADGTEKPGEVLCEEISRKLAVEGEGMMLVFFPFSFYRTVSFIEAMNRTYPGVKMIGGKAADISDNNHAELNRAYVLAEDKVSRQDTAAVWISSPRLHIYENVVCGVEGVGRNYEVTGVEGHYLEEMEGKDGAAWYEGMLGKEELQKDPSLAGIFPLVPEEAPSIAYNVSYIPSYNMSKPWKGQRKSRIGMFMEIAPGMRFSLGYFDPQKIVNQLNQVYQELRRAPVEVLFVYDCLARMWMLHDCAKWETEQFNTTNMSGAMLAGEISNTGGKNVYANSTFVIAGLSESSEARLFLKGKTLKNASNLQHENVLMINYLLQTGNKQLSRQLNAQQDKMQRAMFYHEALELENQTKYLFDSERKGFDKLALLTLRNEQIVMLFMGQSALLAELKKTYGRIREGLRDSQIFLYSYGEHSILLAAGSQVTEEDFTAKAKEVYGCLNGLCYGELAFSYECALVMGETELLQKAEATLQYGVRQKLSFVQYCDISEEALNGKVREEMHMLQILREALVGDRIIPYFQGIYDNRTRQIVMYEALMRVQDEQGKIYYPNQFLDIAKEYNLYEALSTTMVTKVMEQFCHKDVRVSINLNVRDIYDRDILKIIFRYLREAEHPENFVFELLESEEVQDYQLVKQFADSIHEYGGKIAIDDFGSGFSNLLHIIRIDADILKIDGSIIREICKDEKCREFVELINDWCSRQGKEVLGEFVENGDIQNGMEEMKIAYSQGYYFAKPEPWQDGRQ